MARVEALRGITHDNRSYATGSQFECTDAQAEALVASGAAKVVVAEKKVETPVPAQPASPKPEDKQKKPAQTK